MINKFEKYVERDSDHKAKIFKHRSRQLYKFYADKNNTRGLWQRCKQCNEILPHDLEKNELEHKKKKKGKLLKVIFFTALTPTHIFSI